MNAVPNSAAAPARPTPPPALGAPSLLRLVPWPAYVAFWAGIGLFLGSAELQHYLARGLTHPWEPFLWELSSAFANGVLALAVYRWADALASPRHGLGTRVAGHLAGAAAFVLLHNAIMYTLRGLVYAVAGVEYHPGGVAAVLGYEGFKDVVSYVLVASMSLGLRAFLRGQRQAAELARLDQALAAARLERLQEQIHPHFLFNTLNLVSSVMHEDVERADRILSELADLLRQSMSASRAASHALADELRWVEPFLSIMRQRFGERLGVEIDVSAAAAACALPTLLLMAPIENAVKHGVARSSGPARVAVRARVDGAELVIDIVDSGAAAAVPTAAAEGGSGSGLANVRARLAALHGDAAHVVLDHDRDRDETRLRISLPATAHRP
jgi:signal transduction histidine kinase